MRNLPVSARLRSLGLVGCLLIAVSGAGALAALGVLLPAFHTLMEAPDDGTRETVAVVLGAVALLGLGIGGVIAGKRWGAWLLAIIATLALFPALLFALFGGGVWLLAPVACLVVIWAASAWRPHGS